LCLFFFFKQKTAYEIRLSLVGSEMCIRDSLAVEGLLLATAPERLRSLLETMEDYGPERLRYAGLAAAAAGVALLLFVR